MMAEKSSEYQSKCPVPHVVGSRGFAPMANGDISTCFHAKTPLFLDMNVKLTTIIAID